MVLPAMRRYDAAGTLVETRSLVAADDIHKPVHRRVLSLTTLGVLDVSAGRASVTTAGLLSQSLDQIYMALWAFTSWSIRRPAPTSGTNTSSKREFSISVSKASKDCTSPRPDASAAGPSINSRSMIIKATLHIATTDNVYGYDQFNYYRLLRTENHLFVMAVRGGGLETVGSLEHLGPTEAIQSVRFLGPARLRQHLPQQRPAVRPRPLRPDEPASAWLAGRARLRELLAPHRRAPFARLRPRIDHRERRPRRPATFAVRRARFGQPAARRSPNDVRRDRKLSDAFDDHHAVAYFASHGVLSIPIHWRVPDGMRSASWVFDVDIDDATGAGRIEPTGRVDHDELVRRSLRIGQTLVTVSATEIKISDLFAPATHIATVYVGPLLVADQFTVQEDSGATTLDVLANDRVAADARIASVEALYAGQQGTIAISDDGRSLVFTPAADFYGIAFYRYKVIDALRGEQFTEVEIFVEGVADAPRPVNDAFQVRVDEPAVFDVLANDVDPDVRQLPRSSSDPSGRRSR